MSSSFQGGQSQRGTANNTADVTRIIGQMTLLPLTAFVTSLEVFLEVAKGVQRVADQGINATAGGAALSTGDAPGGMDSFLDTTVRIAGDAAAGSAETIRQATREEERKMSDQSWSSSGSRGLDSGVREQGLSSNGGQASYGKDDGWSMSEDCRDKDPCDRLRLIRFKVLFLKRDLEIAFPEQEELVSEDMPRDGFISWKIAEFVQQMSRKEVKQPGKWKDENNYPAYEEGGEVEGGYVLSLPDKDKRFLRVYCQVLAWYDREKRNYKRDQADSLGDIKDELRKISASLGEIANDNNNKGT